LKKLNVFMTL